MKDVAMLALTAALSWGMWRAFETWGAMAMAWMWAWGMWVGKELGYG